MPSIPARIRNIELPPFDPLNTRAAELRVEGHHVISLGQAVPFFPPPPAAIAAARAAIDHPDVHRYATDPGLPSLRSALAARLGANAGATIGADDLIITAGGNHAFALALTTLVDAGDEVILPSPYFTNHQMMVAAVGAIPTEAPVGDRATFALTWQDIEAHLTAHTRAVVLCNPGNPTGAALDAADGVRIVRELAARGIVVISDETYMPFVYDGAHWSAASVPKWRDNVVVIGTFSKMFGMMGWRVGYMVADKSVCDEAVKVQDAMIICAPAISQMAAEGAVRDAWDYAATFHGELQRRRAALREGLATAGLEWTPTRAGLFAFVRIPGCANSTELSLDLLERAHIVTIPGSAFGASGEGYLRLSYGYADTADIAKALGKLEVRSQKLEVRG
jgi:aspartate/methionine/tyrosine aminotransferase